MANNIGNSGIRADGYRPTAVLRKDNYRAWSSKSKAQLKVMEYWRLVSGTELEPPATVLAGTIAGVAAAQQLRTSWLKRADRAAALLITSLSDEEPHTVQAVDEDPVAI